MVDATLEMDRRGERKMEGNPKEPEPESLRRRQRGLGKGGRGTGGEKKVSNNLECKRGDSKD